MLTSACSNRNTTFRACIGGLLSLTLLAGAARSLFAAAQPEVSKPAEAASVQPTEQGGVEPIQLPDVLPQVLALIDTDYFTAAERSALRVKHGLWTQEDLTTPAVTAAAALSTGDLLNPVFASKADGLIVEDIAESLAQRGELQSAVDLLATATSIRSQRIIGAALMESGRTDEAIAVLRKAVAAGTEVGEQAITDGDELAESVHAALLLSRLLPVGTPGQPSHQQMLTMLGKARDELSRLAWKPLYVEALLLYERDKYSESMQAVAQTLALNPRCAPAWDLFAQVCVDTFDFERAERIAARLDLLSPSGPSLAASATRAYIRIRQNEGVAAIEQLQPALQASPGSRRLLALHAAAMAVTFDFEATDALIQDFEKLSPGSPAAWLRVGKAMADARQYEEAARYLRRAVLAAPHWVEPVVALGLSQFQAGQNQEAASALETSLSMDPLNNSAANSLLLLAEIATYATIEGEHFIIRCKPGIDEIVAAEMLEPLEAIYARVTGNGPGGIDHKPSYKTIIELYPNHRWFGVRITGMPALHTIAAATGPVIAMEAPREGPGHMGAFDWRRVVQHEYTHTVTLSRTRNRLPHWFTEASAVYLEDAPRDYNTVRLLTMAYSTGRIFDLDTINIMFVRPKRPTDRSQAYAQGHLMYQFMIETFGAATPLALMDLYATGVREQAAFQRVLSVDRAGFMARFKPYMQAQLQSWGMLPTSEHQDLPQLLAAAAKVTSQDTPPPENPPQPPPAPRQGVPLVILPQNSTQKPAEDANVSEDTDASQPKEPMPEPMTEPIAKLLAAQPKPDPDGATDEQLAQWHAATPANPFVLSELVQRELAKNGNKPTQAMIPLVLAYAAARPVDPLPHRLLAKYYLDSSSGIASPSSAAELISHLEYLDAREQSSPQFALELARQYIAAADPARAVAKANRAAQIAPYDASVREEAARIALRAKSPSTARRHIAALVQLEPQRAEHKARLEAVDQMLQRK